MRQWSILTRETRVALAPFGVTACDDDLRWDVHIPALTYTAARRQPGLDTPAMLDYPCIGDIPVMTDCPRRRVHRFQDSDINTSVISLQWTPGPIKHWSQSSPISLLATTCSRSNITGTAVNGLLTDNMGSFKQIPVNLSVEDITNMDW
jgi:hypothetical protein